ncbi:MAG: regulatory iron-sulfur-containing complex subunit RicT [Catalinimonas sp.]
MNVFDWLSHMALPADGVRFDVIEVRFKNGRKDFYRNVEKLDLTTGDAVVVEVPNGYHAGVVSMQGELVRLQLNKKGVKPHSENIRKVYRLATEHDLEKWEQVRNRESPTLFRTREVIREMRLKMKLTDVEYQADDSKATFYYSADERVDFRQLIKALAGEFRIRVEMRQISLRQEAGRLGGIGSCGRELCCSTWLSSFKSVSTSAARYQNLSLNPGKLSGQCGRLKCCLNYELDTYMDALRDIPQVKQPLRTEQGNAYLQKTDIFRRLMWFGYRGENEWHALPVERVRELLARNAAGEQVPALTAEAEQALLAPQEGPINLDLAELDEKFAERAQSDRRNKRRKKRNRKKPGGQTNT